MIRSPRALVAAYTRELLLCLPGVRDGQVEAIHQARVATRRLREALPLAGYDSDALEASLSTAKSIGRTLGPVRELDVLADILTVFEYRVPATSAATAEARATLRREQRAARRRMIKRLDDVDVRALNPTAHARVRS